VREASEKLPDDLRACVVFKFFEDSR